MLWKGIAAGRRHCKNCKREIKMGDECAVHELGQGYGSICNLCVLKIAVKINDPKLFTKKTLALLTSEEV